MKISDIPIMSFFTNANGSVFLKIDGSHVSVSRHYALCIRSGISTASAKPGELVIWLFDYDSDCFKLLNPEDV